MTNSGGWRPGQRVDWAGLGWMFLFFWFFSGLTQALILFSGSAGFFGFRQALIMSLVWMIPLLLWPARSRMLAAIIGLILWACSLASLGYFLIYGQEFSQSVIFIMFESNVAEGSEYIGQYFSWWMIPVFIAYSLAGWMLWTRVRPVYLPRSVAVMASIALFAATFGYQSVRQYIKSGGDFAEALEEVEQRIEPAAPWQLLVGYHHYRQQLSNMEALLADNAKIPPVRNLVKLHGDKPNTLVLVIGESTNRERMSLYGYSRQTTPRLDAIRDQLQVFQGVVSPRPYTIEALQQILTFADQHDPDAYLDTPSLLNLMKQAGYKTYWITNQQTMTKRNTMLTTFSRQADEQVYLNNNRVQNAKQYDGAVLEPFERVLEDEAPYKFIVVHLLGTHMKYEYRYPEAFARFNGREGAPDYLTDDQLEVYNSYDNAVLYNDYVVSSLIDQFAASKANGFLLYLSDHGEAVFDHPEPTVLGRNEGAPTAAMYTVPFLLWSSPDWQGDDHIDFEKVTQRAYGSTDFEQTWIDLAGLRFDGFRPERSLVSTEFEPRPILIGDPNQPKKLLDFSSIKQ